MKKIYIILLALMFVLTACGNDSNTAASQKTNKEQAPGITDSSIKIGAWLPLTGPIAVHGTVQRIGLGTYFQMVNDKGGIKGRKIEWVVEDNAYDPQKSVAAARKLVERDNVFAIVGSNGTAQSAATFSYLLDQEKVPLLPGQGGARDWWDPAKPNLFGVLVAYEDMARALGRWAAKEGADKIVVVHNDPAAFVNVANNVKPGAATVNPNQNVELIPVKLGTADYGPIALELSNKKPGGVVAILPAEELVALAKAMDRQGLKTPLYTYAPNVSIDTLELGGKAVEGLRAVSLTVPPSLNTPEVNEYKEALKKYAPQSHPDFQSLYMWGVGKVFTAAMEKIEGTPTRDKLIKAFESMKDYKTGILPPVSFTEKAHLGVKELQPVKIENGQWTTVGSFIDPAENW